MEHGVLCVVGSHTPAGVCCTVILTRAATRRGGLDRIKFSGQSCTSHSHLRRPVSKSSSSLSLCKCSPSCQSPSPPCWPSGLHRARMPDSMREKNRDRIDWNYCDLKCACYPKSPSSVSCLSSIPSLSWPSFTPVALPLSVSATSV
jgi:hypothetical protein